MAAQEVLDNLFDDIDVKKDSLDDVLKKYFAEVGTPSEADKVLVMQIYIDKLREALLK